MGSAGHLALGKRGSFTLALQNHSAVSVHREVTGTEKERQPSLSLGRTLLGRRRTASLSVIKPSAGIYGPVALMGWPKIIGPKAFLALWKSSVFL